MCADVAKSDPQASGNEELRQAALRVRRAHEAYEEFTAVAPLPPHDLQPQQVEAMKAAQTEIEIAEQAYARLLREDPRFAKESARAERRLQDGPPWNDIIRPSDLLDESGPRDR